MYICINFNSLVLSTCKTKHSLLKGAKAPGYNGWLIPSLGHAKLKVILEYLVPEKHESTQKLMGMC